MEFTAPFGAWLKEQRARLDLTQGDLARCVGYSAITIRKVEAGTLKPSKQMLDLIADHIGVSDSQRDAFIAFALGKRATDDAALNNLPTPATALIGRDKDVVAVCKLLDMRGRSASSPARLVTLVGPPGVGKTRLAIEVARQAASHFAGGVCWVELAPVTDPNIALSTTAHALAIKSGSGKPVLRLLQDHLCEKQMLLVLDNLEQVLDVAPLIGQVLGAAPKVKVISTSRELLRIAGEQGYTVQPLGDEAITLFAQRAQSIQPDFEITPDNASIIAEICRKLDGLPLAIELAAARIGLFTPKEMLGRLNQRLNVLTGGARDLPARQRTLRATLEWSYGLLSVDEQALFRRLGVFAGGYTLHAVQTFLEIDNDLKLTAEDGLAALMAKSLLARREDHKGESRYFLLETMREFALEKLKAHGEYDLWMERLAWYLVTVNEIAKPLLSAERHNMQFALGWAQSAPLATELEMLLNSASGIFSPPRSNEELESANRTFERRALHAMPEVRANSFFNRGLDYMMSGEHQRAKVYFEQSLNLYRELDIPFRVAQVANQAGHNARERGDVATARSLTKEAIGLMQQFDPASVPFMLNSLAGTEVVAENAVEAFALLAKSESLLSQGVTANPITGQENHAWNLNHLGHVAALRGRHQEARDLLAQSIAAFNRCEYQVPKAWGLLWCHQNLAEVNLSLHDLEQARRDVFESLSIFPYFSDKMVLSWCLATLASIHTLDEEPERGARLWGASEALREQIGCRIAPASRPNRERTVMLLREQLGEAEFTRLISEGAKLSVDEAVEFALAVKCGG